jgi:HK97 family phage major capsid protein
MMKLTEMFKKWLVENCDVKQDATDEEFQKAAGIALAKGTLTTDKFVELTTEKEEKELSEWEQRMTSLEGNLAKLVELQTAKAEEKPEEKETPPEEKGAQPKTDELKSMERLFANAPATDEKALDVRVKEAAEMYGTTKSAVMFPETTKRGVPHPLAGQRAKSLGGERAMETLSDREKAVCGAYAKFLCATRQASGSKNIGWSVLPQHDKELVMWGMDNMKWNGSSDGGNFSDINERFLTPSEKQALIDDSTSGGVEATPIVFDDNVIQTPLLHSELFPLVTQVPLDRGRRIEGVATGTVTSSWGGVDNTAISLFNTASYVTAFDTTVFRWEGAIRIGLDFLSDTPIDFVNHISTQYGERLLEDLDDVIAAGDGTTQPEGVITKSGTTSVSFGGSTTIGNYESLRYGVSKAEHRPNVASSAVFCGTETSFQRVRALPVGAADNRRLFGMGHFTSDYELSGAPYKINESLTNAQIFYAILARYRMYLRRGLTMRTSTEGDTLIRRNVMLMVATARYGGQLERGAVAAVTTDAPA